MKTVNILGCSWNQMDLTFDLVYETYGLKDFRIYKNIPVDDEGMPSREGMFSFSVIEPGESADPGNGPSVFGVTGPRAKHAVMKFLRMKYSMEQGNIHNLVHPASYLASSVRLSLGIIIEPHAIISSMADIGFGVSIKRGASVGHHSHVGDFTEVNPGAVISGHVKIGHACIIGVGAVIRNGASIGDNTFIGMGSLVTDDIPAGVIAYGNPCKVVRPNDKWQI